MSTTNKTREFFFSFTKQKLNNNYQIRMSRRLMSYVSSIVNIIRTVYIYTHTITHPLSSLSASYQHTVFIVFNITYAYIDQWFISDEEFSSTRTCINAMILVIIPENEQMIKENPIIFWTRMCDNRERELNVQFNG